MNNAVDIDHLPWLENLTKQIKQSSLPNILIIEGSSGLGKYIFSKKLIQSKFCSTADGCNNCSGCHLINADTHPDFLNFNLSKDEPITVEYISRRSNPSKYKGTPLIDFMNFTATSSNHRIALINHAQSMNKHAQNALLKTLEDFNTNNHIILISDSRNSLLPTIYSRAQSMLIKSPTQIEIKEWLESIGYFDINITKFPTYMSPLEIKELIDDDTSDEFINFYESLTKLINHKGSYDDVYSVINKIKIQFNDKLSYLVEFLKSQLAKQLDFEPNSQSDLKLNTSKTTELSDLIEEIIDHQTQLKVIPSLNEQIGMNYFFSKLYNTYH